MRIIIHTITFSDKYCERVQHTEEVRDPETDALLHYDFKVINSPMYYSSVKRFPSSKV